LLFFILAGLFLAGFPLQAYSQSPATDTSSQSSQTPAATPPAKTDSAAAPAQTQGNNSNAEVSSQDTGTTFKVRVNLVLVRVVVRDANGKIVSNLNKDDFQLFDNRKPQTISTFSVETPQSHAAKAAASSVDAAGNPDAGAVEKTVNIPQRFVAMVFDDIHLTLEDATFVRAQVVKFLNATSPSDRVGIFSTSGQFVQDFTADREALNKSILKILPRPMASRTQGGPPDCPDISYYQADLIENRHDDQALAVATEDAVQCAFNGDERQRPAAAAMAAATSSHVVAAGDADTSYAYRHLDDIMRRLNGMPGQRIMVLVSPGFIQSSVFPEASELIDRATRANVVINTIDARGLYTPDLNGDISGPRRDSPLTVGVKTSYAAEAQFAQSEVLAQLADGTGGTFFHNRNDVDEGMREAGSAPEFSYLLGFSPQNLKIDGKYHTLKVTFTKKQKYALQARHGYFAPKTIADPAEAAKQEIQEAIFSQEEIHDLPMDLQTQFFKKDPTAARLAVLTHFDLKGIHFRKTEGRNLDNLTIATAIFDENGNLVTGGEKLLMMKLLDNTYNKLSNSGLTVKSSFDVKPGTYLVRQVVRDAEGAQMAARNGAVVIPD
jgi:VWFA-related protein